MPTYEPIQVIVMSPAQLLVVYLAWVAVTLLAVGVGVWVFTAGRRPDPDGDTAGSEVTVELPRRTPHRPRTGTIHAPQYQRHTVDDDTVVIEQTGARR